MPSQHKQGGTALLAALLIVAITAAIATSILIRQQYDIYRTGQIALNDQLYLYSQGALDWAIELLRNDLMNSQNNPLIESTVDNQPIVMPPAQVGEATISGEIYDAQARYNLNTLQDPSQVVNFTQLLLAVDSDLTAEQAQQIATAVSDWVQVNAPTNQFDLEYLHAQPPYRAPHQLMGDVSELRLISGVTPEIYQKMQPYVFALPISSAPININNASIPVLLTLTPSLTGDMAQQIVETREQQPFTSPSVFNSLPALKGVTNGANITVNSSYFLLKVKVQQGSQHLQILTLLQRSGTPQQPDVEIVWQSRGTE